MLDRRIGLLLIVFLGCLSFAALRTAQLGALKGAKLRNAAHSQQIAIVPVPSRRGVIVDRHGTELAVSEPAADVSANPYLIKDPNGTARRIAPVLGIPVGKVLDKLTQPHTGFVYLARQLADSRARRLEALHIEGLDFSPSSVRAYPQGMLGAQLLGIVGIDGDGMAGVEYSQDRGLRGRDGRRRIVKDALGQPISLRDEVQARSGERLELTLDAAIQDKAEEVLAGVGATYKPKGATAIVADPRDGEILAVANWPRIDANDPAAAPPPARQDRAVAVSYEPGSTFKPFTVAGALEQRLVTPSTSFDLAPTIQVADRVIGESHPRGAVRLTTAQILAQSSNVGAITIGMRLGATAFDRWVRRFGFGRTTGVDLPGEQTGIILPRSRYSGSSMGNLPIGQGLAVTPMQMATAYAAIANGGIARPFHIVRRIGDRRTALPRGHRVISRRTAEQIRLMLEGVLAPGGTASEVSIPGYELAGKTGTANKPDPVNGGYSDSRYVASFIGFAPARNPRLLVAVMVDEPQGAFYGGVVAAPAFQKIAAFALPYLRIPPN